MVDRQRKRYRSTDSLLEVFIYLFIYFFSPLANGGPMDLRWDHCYLRTERLFPCQSTVTFLAPWRATLLLRQILPCRWGPGARAWIQALSRICALVVVPLPFRCYFLYQGFYLCVFCKRIEPLWTFSGFLVSCILRSGLREAAQAQKPSFWA